MSASAAMPVGTGALAHVKVPDLSRVLAGPWAAQTLGDPGAEVIKVERPGTGDGARAWGPPCVTDLQGQPTGESACCMCTNRNKQSVTVDSTRPEGQQIVRQLAAQCDVLIENFKTGGLAQYGLDCASLSALNPRLVYCPVTGFGQDGPCAHRAGCDFPIQGMGGLMGITGRPDGAPGGGPMKVGVALTDILAALQARGHTGRGQHIDLALLDVGVARLANQGMNFLYGDTVPQRMGNAHPNTVPYQDFPTADGRMVLAIGNDGQFARFGRAIGAPGWAADPCSVRNDGRLAHRTELVERTRAVTVARTTRDWIALLEQRAVPCGPINTVRDVFNDPQVQARGLQIAMQHPQAGAVPLVASPIRLSDTPVTYRHTPPRSWASTPTRCWRATWASRPRRCKVIETTEYWDEQPGFTFAHAHSRAGRSPARRRARFSGRRHARPAGAHPRALLERLQHRVQPPAG